MTSKYVIVAIAIIGILVVGIALAFVPAGGTVCTVGIEVTGIYNDNAVTPTNISNMNANGAVTNCRPATVLSLFGTYSGSNAQNNIFPTTITLEATLISESDGSVHGPYSISFTVPALNYAYSFSATTTISSVPADTTYQIMITSPVPCSPCSGSTYTTTITVNG